MISQLSAVSYSKILLPHLLSKAIASIFVSVGLAFALRAHGREMPEKLPVRRFFLQMPVVALLVAAFWSHYDRYFHRYAKSDNAGSVVKLDSRIGPLGPHYCSDERPPPVRQRKYRLVGASEGSDDVVAELQTADPVRLVVLDLDQGWKVEDAAKWIQNFRREYQRRLPGYRAGRLCSSRSTARGTHGGCI